ncbi:hypothetical protein LWI28_002806 [Acer negundo]|uniref:ACB domain-containing protein n=1 Tax=Acer negundo TaxID=4023 RepID=A0AAD5JT74_ACENE|nr:hypothetical protein LWI28_002806 [Acer negundo]
METAAGDTVPQMLSTLQSIGSRLGKSESKTGTKHLMLKTCQLHKSITHNFPILSSFKFEFRSSRSSLILLLFFSSSSSSFFFFFLLREATSMELVQELLLTAFIAVVFSFLVAKLVSFSMAGDDNDAGGSASVTLRDVDETVTMEELQFGEKLDVGILESEKRVEFVEESVEKVDELREELLIQAADEIASRNEEIETDDSCQLPEKSEEVVELQKDSSEKKEANADVIEECEDRESMEGVGLAIDDDDDEEWEGIERSEAEKIFEAAAKSVGSGDKDDLLSDVQMELYGLHKVATEGPCRETQPMALMLSARAKWNAWQKLGNMSPEEAMEQYVTLLSDRVPGWREENHSRDGKLESQEAGTPNLSSTSGHHTNYTHERTSESKSSNEGGNMTGGSSLETVANE